jgi:hypothetical protein
MSSARSPNVVTADGHRRGPLVAKAHWLSVRPSGRCGAGKPSGSRVTRVIFGLPLRSLL